MKGKIKIKAKLDSDGIIHSVIDITGNPGVCADVMAGVFTEIMYEAGASLNTIKKVIDDKYKMLKEKNESEEE